MEDYDLADLERRLGVDVDEVVEGIEQLLDEDDDDDEDVGAWLDGDEEAIGAMLTRRIPILKNADPGQLKAVARTIGGRMSAGDRLFASVAAQKTAERALRPNAADTLYAQNEGVACNPGTTYVLRPRKAGTLTTENFIFKKHHTFFRAIVEPIDCSEGFYLVGGSVGFQDDRAKPFDNDVNISVFRPEREIYETPLASLHGRTPEDKTEFVAQVRLDRPAVAGQERIFHGFTLEYYDTECLKKITKGWSAAMGSMDFRGVTKALTDKLRRRIRRRPPARRRQRLV